MSYIVVLIGFFSTLASSVIQRFPVISMHKVDTPVDSRLAFSDFVILSELAKAAIKWTAPQAKRQQTLLDPRYLGSKSQRFLPAHCPRPTLI